MIDNIFSFGYLRAKTKPLRLLYNLKKFSIWVNWLDPTARILEASNHPRFTTNPKIKSSIHCPREKKKEEEASMETEREKHVYLAKLSEQTERYDGMNRFRSLDLYCSDQKPNRPNVSETQILFAPMNILVRLVLFLNTLTDLSSLRWYLI